MFRGLNEKPAVAGMYNCFLKVKVKMTCVWFWRECGISVETWKIPGAKFSFRARPSLRAD